MSCLQCGKHVTLFRRLVLGGEFCSEEHKQQYHEEYRKLILTRLIQAQSGPGGDVDRPSAIPAPPTSTIAPPEGDAPAALARCARPPLPARDWVLPLERRPRYHQKAWPGRMPEVPGLSLEPETKPGCSTEDDLSTKGVEPDLASKNTDSDALVEQSAANWGSGQESPLLVKDVASETRWPTLMGTLRSNDVSTCCFLPLITSRGKLGVLSFGYLSPFQIDPAEEKFMKRVAARLAGALDAALEAEVALEYERQLAQESGRRQILLGITNALVSQSTPEAMFAIIVAGLRTVVPHEYSSLAMYDPGSLCLRIHEYEPEGCGAGNRQSLQVRTEGTLPGVAFTTREPVVVNELEASQLPREVISASIRDGLQSACSIPLAAHDRVCGTLNLGSVRAHAFSAADVEFLVQIARQLALAVENANAHLEIQRLRDRLAEESARNDHRQSTAAIGNGLAGCAVAVTTDKEATTRVRAAAVRKRKSRVNGVAGEDRRRTTVPEKTRLLHALEEAHWQIGGEAGAAARLGMKRTTLQSKMKRLGIVAGPASASH